MRGKGESAAACWLLAPHHSLLPRDVPGSRHLPPSCHQPGPGAQRCSSESPGSSSTQTCPICTTGCVQFPRLWQSFPYLTQNNKEKHSFLLIVSRVSHAAWAQQPQTVCRDCPRDARDAATALLFPIFTLLSFFPSFLTFMVLVALLPPSRRRGLTPSEETQPAEAFCSEISSPSL